MRRPGPLRIFARFVAVAVVLGGLAGAATAAPRTDPAEKVVSIVLRAALSNDFDAFKKVVHAKEKATPDQVTQLEKYTFARVVRQAKWYVSGDDADSFVIDRREDTGAGRVKLYVKDLAHPKRAAVPVALERAADGSWSVLSTSL